MLARPRSGWGRGSAPKPKAESVAAELADGQLSPADAAVAASKNAASATADAALATARGTAAAAKGTMDIGTDLVTSTWGAGADAMQAMNAALIPKGAIHAERYGKSLSRMHACLAQLQLRKQT